MFLSKALLKKQGLSPVNIHKQIGFAFPVSLPDEERILWRREENTLLVQSKYPPVWRSAWNIGDTQVREFQVEELVKEENVYSFRLLANTTKSAFQTRKGEAVRGRVVGLYTVPEQREWLFSRSGDLGVEVLSVQVSLSERWRFRKGCNTVTLAIAQFDGVLRITDVGAARVAVATGVGSAKAFGCGLLSLMPTVTVL